MTQSKSEELESVPRPSWIFTSEKPLGQVSTPVPVARLMASMFSMPIPHRIRILDAGSGRGVLTEALFERLMEDSKVDNIHIDGYELDPSLAEEATSAFKRLHDAAEQRGVALSSRVYSTDFIKGAWFTQYSSSAGYDLVITNPPYSKIRKESEVARMAQEVVYGQPNIYGLFLVLACRLLRPGGQIVAIAPRSWMSGAYFVKVREDILARTNLNRIHSFHTRDKAFNGDQVLQETTIFQASSPASVDRPDVRISISAGITDIDSPTVFNVPWGTLLPPHSQVIRLPETLQQLAALRSLDGFPLRLNDLGLTVSTGPVVPFRATEFLEYRRFHEIDVPLIWMSHVRQGKLEWSSEEDHRQPPFIHACEESRKLLLPREVIVLVRRFSAKEDNHRVIACILPPGEGVIGLENHLNVIRGFGGKNGLPLASAVTNFLNSTIVDQFIRAVSGTTQVNALELRQLPIPDPDILNQRWANVGTEIQ